MNKYYQYFLFDLNFYRKLEKLNMNDLPLVANAKLVAIMLEDLIPNLRIGMVTEQIEEYKKKMKLLKDSDQGPEETEQEMMKLLDERDSQGEQTGTEEESVPAAEDDDSKKEAERWSYLVKERPQRT